MSERNIVKIYIRLLGVLLAEYNVRMKHKHFKHFSRLSEVLLSGNDVRKKYGKEF